MKEEEIAESTKIMKDSDFIINISGIIVPPLTYREEEILHIVNTTPNDMILGKQIRKYINDHLNLNQ